MVDPLPGNAEFARYSHLRTPALDEEANLQIPVSLFKPLGLIPYHRAVKLLLPQGIDNRTAADPIIILAGMVNSGNTTFSYDSIYKTEERSNFFTLLRSDPQENPLRADFTLLHPGSSGEPFKTQRPTSLRPVRSTA